MAVPSTSTLSEQQKRFLKVAKTVRESLKLQLAMQSGGKLDSLQVQKLDRLPDALAELAELERGLPAHSDLRPKNRDILELLPQKSAEEEVQLSPEEQVCNADTELKRRIREQIEYYFSDANLATDRFFHEMLRTNYGWIQMTLLLNCNRLKEMGANEELIRVALADSHLRLSPDGNALRRPDNAPLPQLLVQAPPRQSPAPDSVASVQGRVLHMARVSGSSSRRLQEIIGTANNDEGKVLVQELRGNVVEAAKCYNANFVLKKFIETLSPQAWQFIIDEAEPHACDLARHPVGCRVVQRLIEHSTKKQLQSMVQLILRDPKDLCLHPYGNFVAQCLLEHGSHEQQHCLAEVIQKHARLFCSHERALGVVSKAFCHGAVADREAVARAVLGHQDLLVEMARTRHGSDAVQSLLRMGSAESIECLRILRENSGALTNCRYGRMTAKSLLPQNMHQGLCAAIPASSL